MGHRGVSWTSCADPDVRRNIDQLVNTPREYLKRREAEELRDIQAETRELRAALLAESHRHHHRRGGRRGTTGFVRRVRFS
jgi:hypothetical protein